jgi:hypothetical protein
LSSDLGAPIGLSEVRWTRTTVGGPNYLGGSVTAGIRAKPFSADIMRHLVGTCSQSQGGPTRVNSDVNRVYVLDGKSSAKLASHGHCAGVFIGI